MILKHYLLDSIDVDITEEFNNTLNWTAGNQMMINLNKTKEIVSEAFPRHVYVDWN